MKKISLILAGISSFKRNNPIVFLIYIIGYMLMCFVFIYIYTNYMPSVVSGADNKVDSRYYCFNVQNEECNFEELYRYLRTYKPLYCDLNSYISFGELLEGGSDEIEIDVMTRLDGKFDNFFFGWELNSYEINNALSDNENIVVLSEGLGYKGESITIGGDKFTVVLSEGMSRVIMPYMAYKKHFYPNSITLVVGETLRNGRHEKFLNDLNGFGLSVVYEPSEFLGDNYEINIYYGKKIVVIFGVAVCIFMLLIRFLLEYSKYEYTIYRLVGARHDTVTYLVFSQTIAANGFLIVISVCIYELFYDGLFERINMYRDIHMKIGDYVFMTGVLMLFSAVAAVPFIIYSIRNSVSKCINYYS